MSINLGDENNEIDFTLKFPTTSSCQHRRDFVRSHAPPQERANLSNFEAEQGLTSRPFRYREEDLIKQKPRDEVCCATHRSIAPETSEQA